MKLAIIFLFAAIVSTQAAKTRGLTPAEEELIAKNRATCREQNCVSLEEEQELREGKFYSANERQKCYVRCVSELAGFRNSQGVVNTKRLTDMLKPFIGSKKAKAVGEVCNDITGCDECDAANSRYACYYYAKAAFLI